MLRREFLKVLVALPVAKYLPKTKSALPFKFNKAQKVIIANGRLCCKAIIFDEFAKIEPRGKYRWVYVYQNIKYAD